MFSLRLRAPLSARVGCRPRHKSGRSPGAGHHGLEILEARTFLAGDLGALPDSSAALLIRNAVHGAAPKAELVAALQLAWSSYLGGSATDQGFSVALDGNGSAWVTGYTYSADLASGGFDTSYGGNSDAFVAKINPDGTLAWSTYLGGSANDQGFGIALDGAGDAWVTGRTYSTGWISGGFDTSYGGNDDAFIAKINANGTLAWSSYLGGSGDDLGLGIALDGGGNAWVTGYTTSADLASGGFDTTFGGNSDAFVAKINANGTLAWSSYLGGSDADGGRGIAMDGKGNAWVTGETSSIDFASGGFDISYNGGAGDAFIAKVNANGTLAWSTYVGGSGNDRGDRIIVDGGGNAWLTGYTQSSGWTSGGFDTSFNGGMDAFIAKINSYGTPVWSSYLGGSSDDGGHGIALDGNGGAWVIGETASTDFVSGGFDTTYNGGTSDAFVARISAGGMLTWSSYLGGDGPDSGWGIAAGGGATWVTGDTNSSRWTSGGFDTSPNGGRDAFVAKLEEGDPSPPSDITLSNSSIAENQPVGTTVGTLGTSDPDPGNTFTYTLVGGTGSADNAAFSIAGDQLLTAAAFDFETRSSYSIRVRSTDPDGLYFEKVFTITLTNVNETPTGIALSAASIAENQPVATPIGNFSASDPDSGNSFTYALVSGTGGTDNAAFQVVGSTLKSAAVFDYESKTSYSIRVRSTDQGGLWFEKVFTITITNLDDVAPTVGSVSVNDGVVQRSMLKKLAIVFSEPVTLASGALQVHLSNGSNPPNTTLGVTNPSGDQKTYVLSFSGTGVIGGSLADGIYDLIISAGAVHDLAGNAMITSFSRRFHRLFGDVDGNKVVNALDYAKLKATYGRSSADPLFNGAVDYEGNGAINALDLAQFRKRYGMSYSY